MSTPWRHLGCRHARIYVGDRHDRFRVDTPWDVQIAATLEVIREPDSDRLKERGIRVAIETHADLTVDELLGIIERLDPEVAGVTLDTGNLAMRLETRSMAVGRLAPFVLATHVKDAVLAFTPRGLCWQARPVGSGILPMPDMLAALLRSRPSIALSIELHPRIYDLPIYDPRWLAFFPGLRPESLAAVVRLAAECERRYAEGSLARPEAVEAVPWAGRDLDWLASSLGYLRSVVPTPDRVRVRPRRDDRGLPLNREARLDHDRHRRPASPPDRLARPVPRLHRRRACSWSTSSAAITVVPAILKHHNTYCSYADTIMPQFFFAVGFAYRLTFLRGSRRRHRRRCRALQAQRRADPPRLRHLPPRRHVQVVGRADRPGRRRSSSPGLPSRALPDAGPHRAWRRSGSCR